MRSPAEASSTAVGRSSDLLDQVDYRLAETPQEKEEIYNLRYRAYLREGAVKESPEQRVTDQYDDLPNSWTFGVYIQGELSSSVRISVLTSEWRESCSAEAFGEILHPRLDRNEVIIDPARFVADPDKAKRIPELPYVTLRLAYMACEYFNADLGLAIVRAEHQAFYRKVFLHETIAEPRFFPGLLKPVGLMAADFPALRDKVFERYPMMRSTAFERRMLFERRDERHSSLDVVAPLERTSIVPNS
jgi:hypothetical protein